MAITKIEECSLMLMLMMERVGSGVFGISCSYAIDTITRSSEARIIAPKTGRPTILSPARTRMLCDPGKPGNSKYAGRRKITDVVIVHDLRTHPIGSLMMILTTMRKLSPWKEGLALYQVCFLTRLGDAVVEGTPPRQSDWYWRLVFWKGTKVHRHYFQL